MKTKIIPFDLETAKKIQEGEIKGNITTRDLEKKMIIVCYDSTAKFCGTLQPIIAQNIDDLDDFSAYNKDGAYIGEEEHPKDLVLEVPDNDPQFKPFDKVLVRDSSDDEWTATFFSHYRYYDGKEYFYTSTGTNWRKCIPYEGNEHLVGTTNNSK